MPATSWLGRFFDSLRGTNPFAGDLVPSRVRLFGFGRPSLPFPHPWNYREPLRILDTIWHGAERETGPGRHNRYLYAGGFSPVFLTREPDVIKAVLSITSEKPGHFDRDTAPTSGIARATGEDSLLYSNGEVWHRQKRLVAEPFSRSNLFEPETFHGFEATFRATVHERLEALRALQRARGERITRIALEPEIKGVMLEMLVNNFFGGTVGSRSCAGVSFPPSKA